VPLLPWFGMLLAGLAAGQWVLARRRHWVAGALARACMHAAGGAGPLER
jgi:uncharacterized membrane protein